KLNRHIPSSFAFSKIDDKTLSSKIDSLEIRFLALQAENDPDIAPYSPHCIFDLLFLADREGTDNKRYISFLSLIEESVKSLVKIVNPVLLAKLRETVRQMILSIDEKIGNNFQYLNFFGEIFGLNYILSHPSSKLELLDIEKKLPNGKKVDFVFISDGD